MKTIYDIFKSKHKLTPGLGEFGIEIETETKDWTDYPEGFFGETKVYTDPTTGINKTYWTPKAIPEWKAVEDGSLRNYGMEFVLTRPLDFELAKAALVSFGVGTKSVPFLEGAPATSVHVHMNVTDFTPLQLMNLISVLVLTENLLTEFSGPTRRSNTFARPIRVAEGFLHLVNKMVTGFESGNMGALMYNEQHAKYATINLATLAKYGSIEVRCFRGTTKVDDIIGWLEILHRIYKFSQLPMLTPSELYKTYQDAEYEIVDLIFGDKSDQLKCEFYQDLLRRNEMYLASIAIMSDDWYKLGSKYDKKKKTAEVTNSIIDNYMAILGGTDSIPVEQPWGNVVLTAATDELQDDLDAEAYPDFDEEDNEEVPY